MLARTRMGRLTALRGEGWSRRRIASSLKAEGASAPGASGGVCHTATVQRALEGVS